MNIRERILRDFTYHPPFGDQTQRYERLRDGGRILALIIADLTSPSREQSLAFTHLEEVIFWANALLLEMRYKNNMVQPNGYLIPFKR